METLDAGEHEFELLFRDGSVTAKLMVVSAAPDESSESNSEDSGNTDTDIAGAGGSDVTTSTSGSATATGDNGHLVVWEILLLGCSLIFVFYLCTRKKRMK